MSLIWVGTSNCWKTSGWQKGIIHVLDCSTERSKSWKHQHLVLLLSEGCTDISCLSSWSASCYSFQRIHQTSHILKLPYLLKNIEYYPLSSRWEQMISIYHMKSNFHRIQYISYTLLKCLNFWRTLKNYPL